MGRVLSISGAGLRIHPRSRLDSEIPAVIQIFLLDSPRHNEDRENIARGTDMTKVLLAQIASLVG